MIGRGITRLKRGGAMVAIALLVTACDVAQQAADDVARGQAKRAIDGVVAQRFPGLDATPVTDCVIQSASAQEILQIASASATGAHAEVTTMVIQITQRSETVTCMAGAGIKLFKI